MFHPEIAFFPDMQQVRFTAFMILVEGQEDKAESAVLTAEAPLSC